MKTKHTPGPWRLGKRADSCGHLVYITIKANTYITDRNKVFSTISARTKDDVAISGVYAKNPNNGRTIGETYKELGETKYKPFISEDECLANACLISAAPELLEALTTLYEETADYIRINNLGDIHHNGSMQFARDVIAKAKGEKNT